MIGAGVCRDEEIAQEFRGEQVVEEMAQFCCDGLMA